MSKDKSVKLCRLRDIVLYHLEKQNKAITLGELEDCERDLRVYFKNFLMTLDDFHAEAKVGWIGEEHALREEK